MELRTAESKSLIRRKTVKVNTGAGSRSRRSPNATGAVSPSLFFTFSNISLPFFAFLNGDKRIVRPLKVHKRLGFILFCLFQPKSDIFSRVKAARSVDSILSLNI